MTVAVQLSVGGRSMVEVQSPEDDLIALSPTDMRANPQYSVMWKRLEHFVQGLTRGV